MASCASAPFSRDRYVAADHVAEAKGFKKIPVKSGPFILLTYQKIEDVSHPLRIYIEGDGTAWKSRVRVSSDPTPREPMVLELASIDSARNVVYLARPGQYCMAGPDCSSEYWSGRRFSKEVINATDHAINEILRKSGAKEIELIGYSGGAAVAVLIAAERDDVRSLRTIAGNLDTDAVNRLHRVSAFAKDSLNPISAAHKLARLPMRHFAGSKDRVIPSYITKQFAAACGDEGLTSVTIVDGATHNTGWHECWRELLTLEL